jgi:hypothetical protein
MNYSNILTKIGAMQIHLTGAILMVHPNNGQENIVLKNKWIKEGGSGAGTPAAVLTAAGVLFLEGGGFCPTLSRELGRQQKLRARSRVLLPVLLWTSNNWIKLGPFPRRHPFGKGLDGPSPSSNGSFPLILPAFP